MYVVQAARFSMGSEQGNLPLECQFSTALSQGLLLLAHTSPKKDGAFELNHMRTFAILQKDDLWDALRLSDSCSCWSI